MALAYVEDVTDLIEDTVTPRLTKLIEAGLEYASDLARYYGKEWTEADVPPAISRMVAQATARWVRNPDGFSQNRAGDETLAWQETRDPGTIYFTETEIARIERISQPPKLPGFGSMGMSAWGVGPRAVLDYLPVPVEDPTQNKDWPMYAINDPMLPVMGVTVIE